VQPNVQTPASEGEGPPPFSRQQGTLEDYDPRDDT
jgi:hypothetical protein